MTQEESRDDAVLKSGGGSGPLSPRPLSPQSSDQPSRAASWFSLAHSLGAALQLPRSLPSRLHFPWQQRAAVAAKGAGDDAAAEAAHHLSLDEELDGVKSWVRRTRDRQAKSVRQFDGCFDWLAAVLPCVVWLRTYRVKEYLLWDLAAGISVGFMIVPQGLSYASLAGMPPVFGLYSSFLPLAMYALLGSSRQLGVGPVAVTSLMIGHGLHDLIPESADIENPGAPGSPALELVQERYNQKAIQLALLVSCFYTAVGLMRLGFLMRFLSHSVITGFTSGAAITIALSQVPYLLGVSAKRADTLHEQIKSLADAGHGLRWQELVMGLSMLLMLMGVRFVSRRVPRLKWVGALGPVLACVVSIVVVVAGKLHTRGIMRVIARIPKGLPSPTVGLWAPMEDVGGLLRLAVMVTLVGLLESTSIARALARKNGYALNYNQEVVGLGVANFVGAMFSAWTTAGGFSRSAVNNACGAKTQLAGFVTSLVVMFVLLFLTPVFELLPYNTMAAIVIAGVITLVELHTAAYLFRTHLRDFAVWLVAFLGTLFLGVEIGLGVAVGLAILIAIFESAFPLTAVLGRVGTSRIYRDVKQLPDQVTQVPGVLVCEFIAPLFFANTQWCEDRLEEYRAEAEALAARHGRTLRFVVIDLTPVSHLDSAGAHFMEATYENYAKRGTQLLLVNPRPRVVHMLRRIGLLAHLGDDRVFVHAHDAVAYAERLLLEEEAAALEAGAAEQQQQQQCGGGGGLKTVACSGAGEALQENDEGSDVVATTAAAARGDVELASTKC